jgi:hypothetical protein
MLSLFAVLRDILLSEPSYKVENLKKVDKSLENDLTWIPFKI